MRKTILTQIMIFASINVWCQTNDNSYIRELLNKLDKIKFASYYYYQTATLPYDTLPSLSYSVLKREYIDASDKYVGAKIASFSTNDTSKLEYFYDGKSKAYLDYEKKTIPVDSFKNNPNPYRIVYPPFVTQVKSLLKYALETKDNISISIAEQNDTSVIKLYIKEKLVEVVGRKIVYAEISNIDPSEAFTKYEIWINNVKKIPFRIVKRLPDRMCWENTNNMIIDDVNYHHFNSKDYFPSEFNIGFKNIKEIENKIVGLIAPDWVLKDINNNLISLKDLKSKVVIIQFTGLGCGPCLLSIPYLIKISNEYNNKQLELFSVEMWSNNKDALNKHIIKHGINYKYLFGNNKIKQDYHVNGVPMFAILDEKRVIRKLIIGFNGENTMNDIKATINQILSK